MVLLYLFLFHAVKGSMTQDFLLRVYIMNQSPPPPPVSYWGHLELLQKFAEPFAIYSNIFVKIPHVFHPVFTAIGETDLLQKSEVENLVSDSL
jgi:hypothetical protein